MILDRDSGQVHRLNVTASYIWDLCDGTNTPDEIAAQLASGFNQTTEHVLDDVHKALTSLRELGLLAAE